MRKKSKKYFAAINQVTVPYILISEEKKCIVEDWHPLFKWPVEGIIMSDLDIR